MECTSIRTTSANRRFRTSSWMRLSRSSASSPGLDLEVGVPGDAEEVPARGSRRPGRAPRGGRRSPAPAARSGWAAAAAPSGAGSWAPSPGRSAPRRPARAARRRWRGSGSRCRGRDAPDRPRAASGPGRRSPGSSDRVSPGPRALSVVQVEEVDPVARPGPGAHRPAGSGRAGLRGPAPRPDGPQLCIRASCRRRCARTIPGRHLLLEAGDADLEELVEVAG